jgi:hypothetical protein
MCHTRIICYLTGLREIGIRRVQTAVARCHTHTTWISQSSQLSLMTTTFLARIGDGLASSSQVILKTMIRMRECLSAHVSRQVLAWPGHHRFLLRNPLSSSIYGCTCTTPDRSRFYPYRGKMYSKCSGGIPLDASQNGTSS